MTTPVKGSQAQSAAYVTAALQGLLKRREWTKLIYLLLDWNESLSYDSEDGAQDALIAANTVDITENKNRTFSTWKLAAHTADEQLIRWVMTEAVTFPALFAGAEVAIGTSAAATTTLSIEKNGSEVGTIIIATDNGVTYTSTGSAAVAFAVGDVLTIEGQLVADTALVDVAITLMAAVA
jgi:hypothetical protein